MKQKSRHVAVEESHSGIGRWILPALVVSLLLHGLVFLWAKGVPMERLSDAFYDRIVPRTFNLERVEIDPKLLDAPESEVPKAPTAPVPVSLPEERVSFEKIQGDIRATPVAPQLNEALFAEKPSIVAASLEEAIASAQSSPRAFLDDRALAEQLLRDAEKSRVASTLNLPLPESSGGGLQNRSVPSAGGSDAGFSNLDDLLGQTGPLTSGTAPILMPTDLLFDYDAAALKPEAMKSLEKLGLLIRRNPRATFVIEGHTDSFGSDEYNAKLSQNRADSVKQWLVGAMALDGGVIEARGFGKSRLIAPGTGTIEEQQINRRVEIVIRAPKGAVSQ